ncbi:prephenate dehydratase [Candidatus Pandoraea novymonadis]|nr:prephenate dehydratase [Candidatus Pandoraea novymonadis]
MKNDLNVSLRPLRDKIDSIDEQLLQLLNARASIALEVGEVKKRFGASVFRPEREFQVISRLQKSNAGPLFGDNLAAIWREIMSASRALEKASTVVYLGPVGTYSEQAALSYFGQSMIGRPCPSLDEVFRSVEAGGADFGVIPVENSTEGVVSRTLDLLLQSPLSISGEIALPIHHNLMTQSGNLDGVMRICAHAQSLAQCQHWLTAHYSHLDRQAVSSNAEGARLAAKDATIGAIAGDAAAIQYGLQIAYSHIQDDPHNRTRFVVIGVLDPEATGYDQTSLILSVPNRAGAVVALLEPLARHGVSMTRFESRPAKSGAWEYFFYVDIEGHRNDLNVAAALEELQHHAAYYKILGSYPRAN